MNDGGKAIGLFIFAVIFLVALFSATGFLLGLAVKAFRVGAGL